MSCPVCDSCGVYGNKHTYGKDCLCRLSGVVVREGVLWFIHCTTVGVQGKFELLYSHIDESQAGHDIVGGRDENRRYTFKLLNGKATDLIREE